MTEREALKLALEALQEVYWSSRSEKHDDAITAIKEVLAQSEQEPTRSQKMRDAGIQRRPKGWDKESEQTGAEEVLAHPEQEPACKQSLQVDQEPNSTTSMSPTPLKALQPEQEPYGYLKLSTAKFFHEVEGCNPKTDNRYLALYIKPAQRKPLTICKTCDGTGIVKGLHNWATGGTREEACWNCYREDA